MSKNITPEDEERYNELSERMEAGEYRLTATAAAVAPHVDYSDELDALIDELEVAESDEPTPAAPEGAVTAEQARRALGRPSLSGSAGTGASHRRQTRLPDDLNNLLNAEITATHRTESEILRDALARYFGKQQAGSGRTRHRPRTPA